MSLAKLRRIAANARRDILAPHNTALWLDLFGHFVDPDMLNMCKVSTVLIVMRANRQGVRGARIAFTKDDKHAFVRWRGWIVDATATQFSSKHPPVAVRRVDGSRLPYYWKEKRK